MWRSEDEALLQRIEDELLIEALWREHAPRAPPLHPRAAGLGNALRETERGRRDLEAARSGDPVALRALTCREEHRGLAPAALHHLAVFNARVAAALAADHARDSRRQSEAELGSLSAWIALVSEGRYLDTLASLVAVDAETDVGMALLRRRLQALGARARAGAIELDEDSRAAMRVLSRLSDACRRSGCTVELQKTLEAESDRERARVVEDALSPITAAISDAMARGAIEVEGSRALRRIVDVWNWSDWDEHVERYAIDQATPLAWSVYQLERGFDGLRELLTPLEPLVDNLARRVEGDDQRLAYAAPVAQMYVFRSEMATALEEQQRWAERAVALCSSHRNGRLILARLLCWEVRHKLDQGIGANFEKQNLIAKLDRAEKLYPRTEDIEPLRQRIEHMRWWRGG